MTGEYRKPRLVSSKRAYEGWLRVREDELSLPRTGLTQKYSVLEADDSVIVVPLLGDDVFLTYEYLKNIHNFQ